MKVPTNALMICEKTPPTNRGSDSHLTVKIDWLQFSLKLPSRALLRAVADYLMATLGDEMTWDVGKGHRNGMYYHNTGHSVKGVKVWWNEPGKQSGKANGNALVCIPASAMNGKSQRDLWELMKWLKSACQPKYTRIDVAIDDYTHSLSYRKFLDACNSRSYSGFDNFTPIKPENKKRENLGYTLYMGSRHSDCLLRLYDKFVESLGLINAARLEGEFKNGYAQQLADDYIAISSCQYNAIAAQYLAGCVVGKIDFREPKSKSGHKNLKRRKRLDWWQSFIDRIGAEVKLGCNRICPSLQATVSWIKKQVAPTLAVLRRVLKPLDYRAFLDNLVDEKDATMSPTNEAKAEVWFFERHTVFGTIPKAPKFWDSKAIKPEVLKQAFEQPSVPFSLGQIVRHKVNQLSYKVSACTHTHAQLQGLDKAVSVYLLEPV